MSDEANFKFQMALEYLVQKSEPIVLFYFYKTVVSRTFFIESQGTSA